jgi:trans-2,3-dihydro-3-hydroxyanthranilate isomerase
MRYRFLTADVFTGQRFGGNPLAVLPEARGLDAAAMQKIAREFNLSETVFVLPPEMGHCRRLRIFTPAAEMPFAGHPTIGTALILAATGEVPLDGEITRIVFEEGAGPVPVTIRAQDGHPVFAQLRAPQAPDLQGGFSAALIASALCLSPSDLVAERDLPCVVSCGLPFLLVRVRDREALGRARLNRSVWSRHLEGTAAAHVFLFTDAQDADHDFQARMFAPGGGVEEDPATGSAAAALGGWLGLASPLTDGAICRVIAQGLEIGRPSRLEVEVEKRAGEVEVRVGGAAVLVSEGRIEVGPIQGDERPEDALLAEKVGA